MMPAEWADWLRSTVGFGLGGLGLLLPIRFLLSADEFRGNRRAVVMGATLFWPAFTYGMSYFYWNIYYSYFYPEWMQWGMAAVAFLFYGLYAFAFHWLACRLPGHPLGWFCLFTGLEAVMEHVIAWEFVRLPEKVSRFADTPLSLVAVFAFFEYQLYWGIALWVALALIKLAKYRQTKYNFGRTA